MLGNALLKLDWREITLRDNRKFAAFFTICIEAGLLNYLQTHGLSIILGPPQNLKKMTPMMVSVLR